MPQQRQGAAVGRSPSAPQLGPQLVGGQKYVSYGGPRAWNRTEADATFLQGAIRLPEHLIHLLASTQGVAPRPSSAAAARSQVRASNEVDRRLQLLTIPVVRRQYLALVDTHGVGQLSGPRRREGKTAAARNRAPGTV